MRNFVSILFVLFALNLAICVYTRIRSNDSVGGARVQKYVDPEQDRRRLTYFKADKHLDPRTNVMHSLATGFRESFREHGVAPARTLDTASVLFFHLLTDYGHMKQTLLQPSHRPMHIYSVLCIDSMASKSGMYTIFSKASLPLTHKYCPKTYILQNKTDLAELRDTFSPHKLYILKKNVQRQKGCTITNNLEYIEKGAANNYVVCQRLLQNPLTVRGHKINIRQYLVVVIERNARFFLYNDGFVYYAPHKFARDSVDPDAHITTGYIDRRIYDENPMTVKELYRFLGRTNAERLKRNLVEIFGFVAMAMKPVVEASDSNQHTNFVIMGCDIAIAHNLECKIMEINKGPDLGYKDDRDKAVKFALMQNTLHTAGVINAPHSNFIPL